MPFFPLHIIELSNRGSRKVPSAFYLFQQTNTEELINKLLKINFQRETKDWILYMLIAANRWEDNKVFIHEIGSFNRFNINERRMFIHSSDFIDRQVKHTRVFLFKIIQTKYINILFSGANN